jgi:hypothetical protein
VVVRDRTLDFTAAQSRLHALAEARTLGGMPTVSALWHRLETIHAVTYFAPECEQAFKDAGLKGFWMGYFAGRSAPMGAVNAPVVTATFFNFHPAMVERAIPDAWTFASPATVLSARITAAAGALRRVLPDVEAHAARVNPLLRRAADAARCEGRPLAAANQAIVVGDDPVHELWQHTTTLREHRGDGHVALLLADGLDGCQVHVLASAYRGVPAERLQKARGWTADDWASARDALAARGLVDDTGALTVEGRDLRDDIEQRTDALAAPPFAALGADADSLVHLLAPISDAVLDADVLAFPNPIGLPRPARPARSSSD